MQNKFTDLFPFQLFKSRMEIMKVKMRRLKVKKYIVLITFTLNGINFLTFKQFEKHLLLFRKQMQVAYQQQNHDAYILLQEYEHQVIMARLEKC